MTLMTSRRALVVGLCLAAVAGCGDSCCSDPVAAIPKDEKCTVQPCENGDAFRFGECQASGCSTDEDCCPGSRCRADINACFPLLLDNDYDCEDDPCPDPAQRCEQTAIGPRSPIATCVYEKCDNNGDCGFGRTCFEGRCMQHAPCGGSCPDGTACDVVSNQCTHVPSTPSCDKACDQLRVIDDADTMTGDYCCEVACRCVDKPPLVPVRFGRYSRVAVSAGEVFVSNYDAEYGDLVVARYSNNGTLTALDYVDGVPAGAPVVANPSGPRGGVAEAGENVGTHTAIALNSGGVAHVAYFDEDNRRLKFAHNNGGAWQAHVVDAPDSEDGSVGRFTDVVVAADGTVWLSYLAHNVSLAPITGKATGLKLAKSTVPFPSRASDWELFVVDARPIINPCGQDCGANACVLDGGSAQCLPPASDCPAACSSTETCVTTTAGSVCAPAPLASESNDVPRARGLYTALALDGATPVVAYYDLIDGDVRAARVSLTGAATLFVVDGDGQAGRRGGDVGRFPTVAKIGSDLWIAYEDPTRHEVRVWTGTTPGQGGSYNTVDVGTAAENRPGKAFVGASARLARDATAPLLVYQDASTLDLKLARFAGGQWTPQALLTTGAHGFYADVAVRGDNAFIVSVLAELDAVGLERSRLGLTIEPAP